MKAALVLSCLSLVASASAFAGKVYPKEPVELASISMKATVYYVDASGHSKRMGATHGTLKRTLDDKAVYELGGKKIAVRQASFRTGGSSCNEMRYERSPRIEMQLDKDAVIDVMTTAAKSWYRTSKTEARVYGVIVSAVRAEKDENLDFSGYRCTHSYVKDEIDRESTYEFTTPDTGEKVRLTLKMGKKIKFYRVGS